MLKQNLLQQIIFIKKYHHFPKIVLKKSKLTNFIFLTSKVKNNKNKYKKKKNFLKF